MDLSDLLKEVIASAWTEYAEVEVVRLSYSTWPTSVVITNQLNNGTSITTPDGVFITSDVPMRLSEESQEEIVSNTRALTIQGLNDLVAEYEDMTSATSDERIVCNVYAYLIDRKNVVSSVQASFKYFVLGIDYSQKSNSATLKIATSPTNNSETGIKFTSTLFPSLAGFE